MAAIAYKESRFNPNARGFGGAYGLMQFMPNTGPHYGVFPDTPPAMQIMGGAKKLIEDSKALERMGCFAIVLEKIPANLAKLVSENLTIPTIGIGAGPATDGQVLVTHDLLGITKDFQPRFLRRYLELFDAIKEAVEQYITDVKSRDFPNEKEQY